MITLSKAVKIVLGLIVIFLVFCQLILPGIMQGTISHQVQEATGADKVDVNLSTVPGFMLLAGQLDSIHIDADNAMIGQIKVDKLTLDGSNVRGDFSALDTRDGSAVSSADRLEMVGIISQAYLEDLLKRKLEKVDNIQTTMDSEKLSATGTVKILGRKADITLEGIVFEENGAVYFHMTRLDIRNALLGKAVIGNFFGDILLFDLHKMPVRSEVDDVEMQEGQVVIKASYRKSAI